MDITLDFIDERFKAYVLETYCGNRERIQAGDVEHIITSPNWISLATCY